MERGGWWAPCQCPLQMLPVVLLMLLEEGSHSTHEEARFALGLHSQVNGHEESEEAPAREGSSQGISVDLQWGGPRLGSREGGKGKDRRLDARSSRRCLFSPKAPFTFGSCSDS